MALNVIIPGVALADQLARNCEHLAGRHGVVRAGTDEDPLTVVQSRADLTADMVSWDLHNAEGVLEDPAALMNRFSRLPVLLVTTAASVLDLPLVRLRR